MENREDKNGPGKVMEKSGHFFSDGLPMQWTTTDQLSQAIDIYSESYQ